jgi:hypothetical protein
VEEISKRGVNNKKVDFVVEVEHWKIRWTLVDDKTERLLNVTHWLPGALPHGFL